MRKQAIFQELCVCLSGHVSEGRQGGWALMHKDAGARTRRPSTLAFAVTQGHNGLGSNFANETK